MLKTKVNYFFYALAAIFLTSCEDVVDLPVDESAKQLVVFSNFSDQNNLEVLVYKTKSIASTKPTEYVRDAEVSVYADDVLLEKLHLVIPDSSTGLAPIYQSTDLVPVYDKEYKIEVSVAGYDVITATNSIPTPVNIEDASFVKEVKTDDDGHNTEVTFFTTVSLRDPINVENYYHIKFYQELTPYILGPNNDTLYGQPYLSYPKEVLIADDNYSLIQYKYDQSQSYLLEDKLIDGQYVTLQFNGRVVYDASESSPGRFFIELRTVSQAYFLYHESLNWQNSNGNLHGTSGGVIFDNIDNGVGNFSGFTARVNEFKLSE